MDTLDTSHHQQIVLSSTGAAVIPSAAYDALVEQWIAAKTSKSRKTEAAYSMVMHYFRQHLQRAGLDLFSEAPRVALVASEYVKTSYDRRGRVKGQLAENTINQRLAILSSFYTYCQKWDKRIANPIDWCEREKVQVHDAATHLEASDVETTLHSIPRQTLQGKRDYALLCLALTTGRRAAELVALQWGDLRTTGKRLEVTWRHCKGKKTMHDILGQKTRAAVETYLHALYGEQLFTLPSNAPLFVSLSHNNYGHAMSVQAVANICAKVFGTSKVHTTRHTFAMNHERAGASLSEIGERLGHSSLKTTSEYMQRLHRAENKQIDTLESLYGL